MNSLNNLQSKTLNEFGQKLLNLHRDKAVSFAAAAQIGVQAMYEEFVDNHQQPAFALIRVFRISTYSELTPDMQRLVNAKDEQWLTLMATYGDQPAWCDRRLSHGHACIPRSAAYQSPMISEVFNQLDLRWQSPTTPIPNERLLVKNLNQYVTRYFHVPQALDNQYIVAQDDFVKPYQIKSVIGLGSQFTSGSATIAVGFSKVHIDAQVIKIFAELGPYLFTLLANKTQLWDG